MSQMSPLVADQIRFTLQVLGNALGIYVILLLVRVLLTWFPNIDWDNPVFATLASVTDPYLNLFRNIIPPIGGLDLSAILAFIVLNLLRNFLSAI